MLTLVYMALAGLGCLYGVLAAFVGHGADASAGPGAVDAVDAVEATAPAAFHFPFFSPLALATVAAATGGYGLITKFALDAGDGASLAMALPAALLTGYGVTWVGWRLAGAAPPPRR